MAFIPTDLYLTSGSVGVFNSWTPSVTKFNTSTFYNWEQDNEPLYDLDERTEFLWERLGYPVQDGASSITGKVFVVSADASFAVGSDSSGIIFRDLSSVISILPNPITYPIIIEVASFGDLGTLHLKNIKIDESCQGAGLEIVNRNFGRTLTASGAIFDGAYVSSTDLYNTFVNTKSIRTNTLVASAVADTRWEINRAFISPLGMGNTGYGLGDVYLSFNTAPLLTTNKISVASYTNTQDNTINTNDFTEVSSYSGQVYSNTATNATFNNGVKCFASVYGNYLTKVKIENCGGPIYLRNFCVDGAKNTYGGSLDHSTESGFEIINSNVYLENCFALRCKKEGFNFSNSDIKIRRGIFGLRNYPLTAYNSRDTSKLGIGLLAVNSKISIESQQTPVLVSGIDIPVIFGYNDIGVKLINSYLGGGDGKKSNGTLDTETGVGMLTVINNTNHGMILDNSVYEYEGVTNSLQNYNGIQMSNSTAKFPILNVAYSQNIGLNAINSKIVQNDKLIKITNSGSFSDNGFDIEQVYFGTNGQHLVLNNSIFTYTKATDMPSKFGTSLFHSSFGYTAKGDTVTQKPSIEVINNSYADFVNAKVQVLMDSVSPYDSDSFNVGDGIFGACIKVDSNSKAKFAACVTGPTILLGPRGSSTNVAVAYANQNSEIEFNGNTLIAQGGVDVLVDNGSTVRFNPHKTESGSLDVSSWTLSNGNNHTKVELLSTRSCLVADNNSNILMEHLGDIHSFWPASQTSSIDYNQNNSLNVSAYSASGYLQFYPNGQDFVAVDLQATNARSIASPDIDTPNNRVYASGSREYFLVNYKSATASSDIANYSTGGMCLRALHGSKVKVFNVNFPAGWANCTGQIYDVSSSLACDKLRIWNICDNSELDAAYCAVSGLYPTVANYKGPSAVYLSGAGVPASGAPAGTPDTGSLSVLDWYGASGANTGTNYGPFRLYFSPRSRAKFLTTLNGATSDSGQVYQLLSQGYNPSAFCSGVSTSLSSIYSDIATSAFYYVSTVFDSSFANRVRLDESAANIFSNAKHNAITKSGRVPLTTIYKSNSSTTIGSQAYDAPAYGRGKGFKSSEIFDLRRDN